MEQLFAKAIHRLNSSEKSLKKALAYINDIEDEIVELVERKQYGRIKLVMWDCMYNSYRMMVDFVNSEYGTEEEPEERNKIEWNDYLWETENDLRTKIDGAFLLGDSISINRRLDTILETECTSIFNKGMYSIMAKYCDYAEICGGLESNPCIKCTKYGGKHDIEWIGEHLPPYHPECRCVVKYEPRKQEDNDDDNA